MSGKVTHPTRYLQHIHKANLMDKYKQTNEQSNLRTNTLTDITTKPLTTLHTSILQAKQIQILVLMLNYTKLNLLLATTNNVTTSVALMQIPLFLVIAL